MQPAGFKGDRAIPFHKPLHACAGLQIELKGVAQIGMPDARGTHPSAAIEERHPARSSGEVIAKMWGKAHQPFRGGGKFCATKQLTPNFPIPAIPMILASHPPNYAA